MDRSVVWMALVIVTAACAPAGSPGSSGEMSGSAPGPAAGDQSLDACSNDDRALSGAAFVVVQEPFSGERVAPGFSVRGCSRTNESNVVWRLLARDGSELAAGFTTGGGGDGPAEFRFSVEYSIGERQIGHLEVGEPQVTDEGFPPGRNVIPVVLLPPLP